MLAFNGSSVYFFLASALVLGYVYSDCNVLRCRQMPYITSLRPFVALELKVYEAHLRQAFARVDRPRNLASIRPILSIPLITIKIKLIITSRLLNRLIPFNSANPLLPS